MIIRSSADMVDLLLISLGPTETLGRMTTPVGVKTFTQTPYYVLKMGINLQKESKAIQTM